MPRWPEKPETWKPTETDVTVPGVGTVQCVAVFDHDEKEGTGKHYVQFQQKWIDNKRTHWNVTVSFAGHKIETTFSQGSAFEKPPTAQSVLSSLALDASCGEYDFEEFCLSLGYDDDSRTAERIWKACREIELQMRRMFGSLYEKVLTWGNEQ